MWNEASLDAPQPTQDPAVLAERVYLALSGSVVADSALVRRLGHAVVHAYHHAA